MSKLGSDLKRIASSSGLYAVGEVLNRGLAFLLLPIYTRFLPQEEYGALDLFNAFSGVLFACLLLGMPSALTKVYHRDCRDDEERAAALPTALLLDLPLLLLGGGLVFLFAEPLGHVLIGREGMGDLVRLLVSTAVSASLTAIVLSSFRTREKPLFFVGINLLQFVPAMALNIVLVVHMGWGIRGVLFGNLVSSLVALPVGLWLASQSASLRFNRRLVKPLLHFGVLLIPVTLASWVIDLSDRYVLRIYHDLEQNAIYGVGYKIGMILQMAIVWPFQLAWPAVSFSISKREGHQTTYARHPHLLHRPPHLRLPRPLPPGPPGLALARWRALSASQSGRALGGLRLPDERYPLLHGAGHPHQGLHPLPPLLLRGCCRSQPGAQLPGDPELRRGGSRLDHRRHLLLSRRGHRRAQPEGLSGGLRVGPTRPHCGGGGSDLRYCRSLRTHRPLDRPGLAPAALRRGFPPATPRHRLPTGRRAPGPVGGFEAASGLRRNVMNLGNLP